MIDLTTQFMKARLTALAERITRDAEADAWAHGAQTIRPQDVVPPFSGDPGERTRQGDTFERLTRRVQSLGPRVLAIKRATSVGSVDWGGDNEGLDDRLTALPLRSLAREALASLLVSGIAALRAYRDEATGAVRLERLGGYLEPLYDDEAITSQPVALLQVTTGAIGSMGHTYTMRVYDFEEAVMRTWRDRRNPYEFGATPQVLDNAPMPQWSIINRDSEGMPVGELAQALAHLREDVALQLRTIRLSEAHVSPILYMIGSGWADPLEIGGSTVLRSDGGQGASAGRIEPANLATLFQEHDRVLERIRGDLALPVGFIGSGQFPSGEALEQANTAFISNCQDYALTLSELLTKGVAAYAALLEARDAPAVSVLLNREAVRRQITAQARADYAAGIIPLRVAVLHLAAYYPLWDSSEIEAYLEAEENLANLLPTLSPAAGADPAG